MQWYNALTRREFTFGIAVSGIGLDEPDAVLVENFTCGSVRNYINYCNEPLGALIEKQSSELDPKKRRAQVADILKWLEAEAARPVVAWLMSPFVHWPHVKGLTAHHSIYNFGRMQDVWVDREPGR